MEGVPFRRLVVAMAQGEASQATLRQAAELARRMRLDLHCLLVEDEALFGLAGFPFARELRLPTHEWRKVETGRLADEFAHLAAELRATLDRLGTSLGIVQALEVQRGDPAECLGGLCLASDMVVLAASRAPRPHPLLRLQQAALRSAASVLLLPPVPTRRATFVAAILAGPADAALPVAAGIAAVAGEALLLVQAGAAAEEAGMLVRRAEALGVPPSRIAVRRAGGTAPDDLLAALGATRESLIVLDHAAWPQEETALGLAAARGVPVLLIEGHAPAPASA
jgi:hypothetical protein